MRDVTLKQLRSLAAVVEAGTYAGAAERLHVTAPAVAQQVRLLERRIGLPLFDRTAQGARPTDAGRELLATISRLEAELEGCRRNLELIRQSAMGTVSLGAVSTAKYFAPQVLAGFWRRHPSVEVRLVVGNRDEVVGLLATNDVDLVVMGRPPQDLDVVTEPIGEHPSVLIASPRHRLANIASIEPRELAAERFLVREVGSGTRSLTEGFFAGCGLAPTIAMEITSNETIKQAVMADLGVAVLSAHTVAAEVDSGRLVVLDVVGMPIVRRWFAVRRASLRPGPAGQRLWSFLTRHTADYLPSSIPPAPATP